MIKPVDNNNYITKDNYPEFKAQYDVAVSEGREAFDFEGQYVLTAYAKYVCEYADKHCEGEGSGI